MFNTYEEALDWIHARLRLGIKPGLKRMQWMMEKLDHPETKIKTVHIGGTNGKGSTVTFLRSILEAAGYRVGTFTSPYIEHFNERISVNGKPVSDEDLVELTNAIKPLADELEETDLGGPTEFEVITAMSLLYFVKLAKVDIVLYEVGLGGRFDSTNIIYPYLSVITNIGLDHTAILGDTHEQIAFEKAGIIKKHTAVVTGVKREDALKVITAKAEEEKSALFRIGKDFSISEHASLSNGEEFSLSSPFGILDNLKIGMIGQHQTENASLAVLAAQYLKENHGYRIGELAIREGLREAFWPGRFEVISEKPLVILDGAHNDEGIQALANELKNRFKEKKVHVVFTALKDKKLDKMIAQLDETADKLIFVSFDFPRASSAADLMALSKSENKSFNEDWKTAIIAEIDELGEEDVLIITGSLYFISEAKPTLREFFKKCDDLL